MATVTIYVGKKKNSNKLALRDSKSDPGNDDITTGVNAGDTVKWVIDDKEHLGISSILKVKRKNESDSHHLLKSEPEEVDKVWQGTVKSPSVGKDKIEKYFIKYTVEGSDDPHKDDPKLKMNN